MTADYFIDDKFTANATRGWENRSGRETETSVFKTRLYIDAGCFLFRKLHNHSLTYTD